MRYLCARRTRRRGTTLVEASVVLPVFLVFLFGLFEVGRAIMVNNMLKASCRNAARFGSSEGVTSEEIEQRVRRHMASTLDANKLHVIVKDAGVYDTGEEEDLPQSNEEYDNLPDIEVNDAETGQRFLVRATVNYDDLSFLPLDFTRGLRLEGQAITRHE